jgi:hypothetical protein
VPTVGPVDACCLLFFTSTLQGWGAAWVVGAIFLLCRVQVLHPQFDLDFFRSSFQSKF